MRDGSNDDTDVGEDGGAAKPKEVSKYTNEKLIVLATFSTEIEAEMFRMQLSAAGIESRLANELSTPLFGGSLMGSSSSFWLEVLVRESDANRGLEIKNVWNEADPVDLKAHFPEWICGCGETVDAGFGTCWNCGAEYRDSPAEET